MNKPPGLTIVAGRNGSGKSSFSEALEIALTGNTYRWNKKNKKSAAVWSEHWRNLHDGVPCEIRIELAEEGAGITAVGVEWADGGTLTDRKTWVQRPGKARERGMSSLGWDRAIELYQPILSYDELGGLLEAGPSALFDKLDAILGIEQATDAHQRLGTVLKRLQEPERSAKGEARELKKRLADLRDERAGAALVLLRKHRPDLDALQAIATGTTAQSAGELAKLKALTLLRLPSWERIGATAQALRDAADKFAQAGTSSIDMAERRTELLRQALAFHEHGGDSSCPLCGQGVLDDAWRQRVERDLAAEDDQLGQHRQARRQLNDAREAARTVIREVGEPAHPGRFDVAAIAGAHAAWLRWSQEPDGDSALAEHLESAGDDLATQFELLRDEATKLLAEHEDAWAPFAAWLARWVDLARNARETEPRVRIVEAAVEFMKTAVEKVRNSKLERLKATARDIWAALRQESNVDLGTIELKGTGTRRRVELHAEVDGAEAQALGVMSQGELQALALALFLPRATMGGSPFRFIVLDDPIQAMDPAKVDGFVRVLADLAEDRQVIVFSHDDRLTQTVRQMGINARLLQVAGTPTRRWS